VAPGAASLGFALARRPEKSKNAHYWRRIAISMTDKYFNGANVSIEGLVVAVNGWRLAETR
jgi:hypothetical protein